MEVDDKLWLGAVLASLGVSSMTANLSGSGDSGDIDDVTYMGPDGQELDFQSVDAALTGMTIDNGEFLPTTFLDRLHTLITEDAGNVGDYYNNDGGSVWISYKVSPEGIEIESSSFNGNPPDFDDLDDDDMEPEYDDENDIDGPV